MNEIFMRPSHLIVLTNTPLTNSKDRHQKRPYFVMVESIHPLANHIYIKSAITKQM